MMGLATKLTAIVYVRMHMNQEGGLVKSLMMRYVVDGI